MKEAPIRLRFKNTRLFMGELNEGVYVKSNGELISVDERNASWWRNRLKKKIIRIVQDQVVFYSPVNDWISCLVRCFFPLPGYSTCPHQRRGLLRESRQFGPCQGGQRSRT